MEMEKSIIIRKILVKKIMITKYIMEEKKDINCEELAKKMNECLEQGDNEKCKEFVEEFNMSCKKEENKGLLSWFSTKKEEDKEEEKKEE